jgi:hypothetical protein
MRNPGRGIAKAYLRGSLKVELGMCRQLVDAIAPFSSMGVTLTLHLIGKSRPSPGLPRI